MTADRSPEVTIGAWALLGAAPTCVVAAAAAAVAGLTADGTAGATLAGWAAVLAVAATFGWKRSGAPGSPRARLQAVAAGWVSFTLLTAAVLGTTTWATRSDRSTVRLDDPMSALFEAASAVSTTGLTMLADPSTVPAWLQFARSALQWIGCLGVVVFAVAAAEPSGDHDSFAEQDWDGVLDDDRSGSPAMQLLRRVVTIVALLTVGCFLGLVLSGERVWVAVNHAMTAAATGGFTITRDSVTNSSGAAQAVIAVTVVLAAVSFGTIVDVARRRGTPLWRRTQVRWGLAFTVAGAAAAVLADRSGSMWATVFESVSASTTAGFHIVDEPTQATLSAVAAIGIVSMLIGGAAGSTAGGLKVARVVWLMKAVRRWHPSSPDVGDRPYVWDGEDVPADEGTRRVFGAAAIATSWFALLAVGTIALTVTHSDYPLGSAFYDATSALSGVGLGSGQVDADLGSVPKAIMSLLMIAGRVEITALAVLVVDPFLRARR